MSAMRGIVATAGSQIQALNKNCCYSLVWFWDAELTLRGLVAHIVCADLVCKRQVYGVFSKPSHHLCCTQDVHKHCMRFVVLYSIAVLPFSKFQLPFCNLHGSFRASCIWCH